MVERAEWIYETLCGEAVFPVESVENAFADDMPCEKWYLEAEEAYARLRERLGVEDEDRDVETILTSFLRIQKELCLRMYEYGRKDAEK